MARQQKRLVRLWYRFRDWLTEPIFDEETLRQQELEMKRPPGQTQLHWFVEHNSDE